MIRLQTFLSLILFSISAIATAQKAKPNVIIIMADDMGYGDMGHHNNPIVQTPVLDNFAKESVSFSNFYVSPVCAPTRASLLTGRYNIRTGVFDTYSGGAKMASDEQTIAEIFKQASYRTGIFGKWHLGDSYPFRPQDQGFDESVWHLSGGIGQVGDIFNYYEKDSSYFNPKLYKNGKIFQSKGYCSNVYTDEAIDFIESKSADPFLLYLSFNAPHTPLQVPEEYLKRYEDEIIDPQLFRENGYYMHDMQPKDIEDAKKVYAMVTNIDDNIGRLFTSLKENNLYDNTIIIFLTDNGPEQYRYIGGYRGKKGQVREGGIHVPFYMKVPKHVKSQKKVRSSAAHIDVLPTLAEMCGVEIPDQIKLDGISLKDEVYDGIKIPKRPLFFEWQRSYPEKYRNMAVMYDDYKLIANSSDEGDLSNFELYNMEKDPYEAVNIKNENKSLVIDLKSKIDGWFEDIMKSKHITEIQRIIIGSPKENHTILNRNDASGLPLIWDQDDIYVRWDIEIEREGYYQIKCHFKDPIENSGEMVVRIGQQHLSKKINSENTQSVTYNNVLLKKGKFSLESWYYIKWKEVFTPFYIEVISQAEANSIN